MLAVTVSGEDEWHLYSSSESDQSAAWAEERGPGLAKDHAPIVADVKPGAILSHKGNIQSHGKHA